MKRFISIKNKLLLLLSATIALILLLIALSLGFLIEQYFERDAERGFARFYGELSRQLLDEQSTLSDVAQRLARRSDIVSSINMISRYANPDHYQPLVYDSEKRNLALGFRNEARAAAVDEIAAYNARGELIAYYSQQQTGYMGYLSYTGGEPILMQTEGSNGERTNWQPGELPGLLTREIALNADLPADLRYLQAQQGVVLEYRHPVHRRFGDGTQTTVGHIVMRKLLGETFVNNLSDKTGIRSAVILANGSTFGELDSIEAGQLQRLQTVSEITLHLPFTHYNLPNHFAAAVAMKLAGSGRAVFVSALPKSVVEPAINETFSAVLIILLLSASVILPLGIVVSRRTITQPLTELLAGVEAVKRGEYGARVSMRSQDEFGTLAGAFNAMSDSILERESMLSQSEEKYRTLVDNLPQRIFLKDHSRRYASCNRTFAEDNGLQPNEIVGLSDEQLFSPELADIYFQSDQAVLDSGRIQEFEEPYLIDGRECVVQTVKTPLRDADSNVVGLLGIFWDITEKKQADEKLRQSAVVFESTADGVMITDADNRVIAVNKAFCEITGYVEREALGMDPSFRRSERQSEEFYAQMWQSLQQYGRWQGEIWNRRKNGEVYPEWMTVSVVRDESGKINNYVSVFSDITQVKRSQMQLDHMAHHDPLTDLPNRTLLADRLSQAIHRARRTSRSVAVLFIDLDRFKNVNDTLGHPSGDLLLQDVARRLQHLLREDDTVARLGGDEFIVVMEGIERPDFAESVASKIIDTLSKPFTINDHELFIGASIGISLYPSDDDSPANLIKYADTAMYRAKEMGRNTYQFYTQELTTTVVERLTMESALRRALENDQLELHFQPQVELDSSTIIGAEALLRWRHPEFGMVRPDKFIPLAEEAGLIVPIGEWVLQQSCRYAAAWSSQYPAFRRIAVNLSIAQLERSDFVDTVSAVLAHSGLSAEMLELEITEGMLMQFPEVSQMVLTQLRELGIELAIDDFGTGYSSLSYLKRFPIQCLKIDRSFVMDLPEDSNDAAITRAVIALGQSLQLKLIAEGVESVEQARFLLREGCHLAQGHYYMKPVPPEEFLRLLSLGRLP